MLFFDMDFQPRYRAQGESAFFADGRAQRRPPAGTIAYGGNDYFADAGRVRQDERLLQADTAFYQGKQGESWLETAPVRISMPRLRNGQEYYETLCAVCHGGTGSGNGIMKEYGFNEIPSLVDARVQQLPDGQIYHTIAKGKGLMQGYGHQLDADTRWSVVLYVRALQRARSASLDDVPTQFREELENQ
jgi:mono/diheme cytochrome c family protein